MTFRTILVGIDGSSSALTATDIAADLAQHYDAQLILLHVVTSRPTSRELREIADLERIERLRISEHDLWRSLGESVVQTAAERAREKGAKKVETVVETGDPATTIIAVAKARAADLIVVGRRGLSDLAALLMGSVSHKLIQLADRPCLTIG